MLTPPERIAVEEQLALAISASGTGVCAVAFLAHAQAMLPRIPALATPEVQATLVVGYCLEHGWRENPTLLDMLLEYLVTNRGRGELQALKGRVPAGHDPLAEHYGTAWVRTNRPFFDRATLRDYTRRLLDEPHRPVLHVGRQADRFGRSHTLHYLEHLASTLPYETHVISEELSRGNGPSYEPEDLARSLASQMGVTDDPPPQTGSSHARQLGQWLLGHIRSKSGRWVIVLDGFGQPGVPDEVLDLIAKLAADLGKFEFRAKARLVLLGYSRDLPQVSAADCLEEELPRCTDIDASHLLPCVEAWNAERARAGKRTLRPDELPAIAQAIADGAPADGKGRLEYFHAELSRLHQYPDS